MSKSKVKVALIGSYPPPYGGISVHIKRFKEHLKKNGFDCKVYTFSESDYKDDDVINIFNPKIWLIKFLFTSDENIIHCHSPDWKLRLFISLMILLNKKVVISVHGESLNDSLNGNWIKRLLVKISIRCSSAIIVVNSKIRDLCLNIGVKSNKIYLISPFISPIIDKKDLESIPKEVYRFINDHNPIISANAFKITFYNGEDLYGLDMCIESCYNLKNNYPNIGFIISIPDIGNYEYFEKLNKQIDEKGVRKNFYFINKQIEFYPIIINSDIFLRPTNTDGDSVSIRESLYFKTPVITSNVVPRPEGTILFKNRNVTDLTLKINEVLSKINENKFKLNNNNKEENVEKIINLYFKLTDQK